MSNDESTPGTSDELTDEELNLETFDADHDGKIGVIDGVRAELGLIDARLEEEAAEGGIKGKIADALHHVVDKLDND